MTTNHKNIEYFVRHSGYWENSTVEFSGPYSSRKVAETAVKDIEKTLGHNLVTNGSQASDLRYDHNYSIVPASQIHSGEFATFIQIYYTSDQFEKVVTVNDFDAKAIRNKRLAAIYQNREF